MTGGAGDDMYILTAGDVTVEAAGGGVDTVKTAVGTTYLQANVENLIMVGRSTQLGVGNDLDNVIVSNGIRSTERGFGGNDTLVATGGIDTMTGGAGDDVFQFQAFATSHRITDFVSGSDKIDLTSLLADVYDGSDLIGDQIISFAKIRGGVNVMIDTDGAGGAAPVVLTALTGVTSLTNSDFIFG